MTLSAPAQKLLSEQPELCEEIFSARLKSIFDKVHGRESGADDWRDFVQKATGAKKDWEIVDCFHDTFDKHSQTGECGCPIKSVKRLSDGEVFTVGDKTNFGVIEKMIESWIGLEVQFNNMTAQRLSVVEKSKALFTTEDGKQIFEGHKFWTVALYDNYALQEWKCHDTETGNVKDIKYFSTKEAAEEYILLNKPRFSVSEINKCKSIIWSSPLGRELSAELIELSKQKT